MPGTVAILSAYRSRTLPTADGARSELPRGREQIVALVERKWVRELDYRPIKERWAHNDNRIAVRFAYEWREDVGNWFRS